MIDLQWLAFVEDSSTGKSNSTLSHPNQFFRRSISRRRKILFQFDQCFFFVTFLSRRKRKKMRNYATIPIDKHTPCKIRIRQVKVPAHGHRIEVFNNWFVFVICLNRNRMISIKPSRLSLKIYNGCVRKSLKPSRKSRRSASSLSFHLRSDFSLYNDPTLFPSGSSCS